MGVTCPEGSCNIQLITLQSGEFELDDGVEFQTYLDRYEAKIFKFTIPHSIRDDDHLIIKGSPYRGSAQDFSLSANLNVRNKEAMPSSNLGNKKGISAWKKGQVMRI